MVEIQTFVEGFDDLEKLYMVRKQLSDAKYKVKRVLVNTSLGSLEDKSIISSEERSRFYKLSEALDNAADLLRDKIKEQELKCISMNVVGFTIDEEEKPKELEENEFF